MKFRFAFCFIPLIILTFFSSCTQRRYGSRTRLWHRTSNSSANTGNHKHRIFPDGKDSVKFEINSFASLSSADSQQTKLTYLSVLKPSPKIETVLPIIKTSHIFHRLSSVSSTHLFKRNHHKRIPVIHSKKSARPTEDGILVVLALLMIIAAIVGLIALLNVLFFHMAFKEIMHAVLGLIVMIFLVFLVVTLIMGPRG
ncbi:MAG: hypothetical protein GC181_07020 [Bacteroidetes bacterium]|nr:hypothetical protein [Bacteroidota bacterium]